MELIDIGCNLTHDSFDQDLEEVLHHAREAGVKQFIVTGASNEGMQKAHELALARPASYTPPRACTRTMRTRSPMTPNS